MTYDQGNFDHISFDTFTVQDWERIAQKSLSGKSISELTHVTASGQIIEPLYTQRPKADASLPVEPMQRWDNRLAVIGETATTQNANALEGLQGGVDSLQIQVDCAEQKAQVSKTELADVLSNVQLELITVSVFAGSEFSSTCRQLESIYSSQGVSADKVRAAFNADPIGSLAHAGRLPVELNSLLENMSAMALEQHISMPLATSVCVNGTCYHNAGATIEQELVSIVATGTQYLQTLLEAGLDTEAAAKTIVFQVACDADTVANIVKLRALRQLWLHVAEQMGITNVSCRVVAETSRRMQSRLSPWVNHLRNVSAATSAAMGGAQSIVVHPHNLVDHQYIDGQPALSARVARNLPIMLSEESAVNFVHDPTAGSYAIETLTQNLIDTSWHALQSLEREGGLVNALTTGQWQADIAAARKKRVKRLQENQDIMVGVNQFQGAKSASSSTQLATNKAPQDQQQTTHRSERAHWAVSVKSVSPIRDAVEFED